MRYPVRLLLLSVAAVVLIVGSTFFADWFVIHIGGNDAHVDLRHIRVCAPRCSTRTVSSMHGAYPTFAFLAFWSALPLFVIIATQAGAKLLSGFAYKSLATLGSAIGAITFFAAFAAGFLAAPDDTSLAGFDMFVIERAHGPAFLVLGAIAGIITVRYAAYGGLPVASSYIPVVVPKPAESRDGTKRIPVTPLSVNKLPTPVTRTRAPTQEPLSSREPRSKAPSQAPEPRSKAPSQAPAVARTTSASTATDARTKPPSQPPALARTTSPTQPPPPDRIDVAARLGGGPLADLPVTGPIDVTIRPPLPAAPSVPEDQIPVAPESGLVIRKRPPSSAPLMASVASALGVASPVPLQGKVKYAVTTAAISSAGLTATREDGLSRLIAWRDIVGIVARRLPPTSPYDGAPFVDIVSTAGSTMRILPSSELSGHTFTDNPMERARALVNLLAAQALDATLDSATRTFASGTGPAAQLRDDKTLAAHDDRLA